MNNKLPFCAVLFCLLNLVAWPLQAQMDESGVVVEIQAERDFGYSLGDRLELTALIDTPLFYRLEKSFLPQPGFVNSWLYLHGVELDDQTEDHDYRLKLSYQLFKAVDETSTLTIPAMPIRFQSAGHAVDTVLPEWSFSYHPILPKAERLERFPVQAPLPAQYLANPYLQRLQISIFLILLLALYLLWFYNRLPFIENYGGPFGKACKTLRRLARQKPTGENYRQALRCFHHALNETAGETVIASNLAVFFQQHPAYQGLQAATVRLFQISQTVFFNDLKNIESDMTLADIEQLCQAYRKIERAGRWL